MLIWKFSYYSILAVLALLTGYVTVRGRRQVVRPRSIIRITLGVISITALVFAAALPAILFPRYEQIPPSGPHEVKTALYTFTDTERIESYNRAGGHRRLTVEFWYPRDVRGKLPLVVFSHGSLGVRSSNKTLYTELASHGYVVCSIDHTYHSFFATDVSGRTTLVNQGYLRECLSEDPRADIMQSFDYYTKWMGIRTADIGSVIDTILTMERENDASEVFRLVDPDRIGVMGHSLGGAAALGMGRLRDDIRAVIAFEAPYMCDISGVVDGEFVYTPDPYPVPVLNIYSDAGWQILGDRQQYRANFAMLSSDSPTTHNVHISGVGHLNLTDLSLTSPILTRLINGHRSTTSTEYCLQVINKVCLQFFDYYLKGVGEFSVSTQY